MTDRQTTIDELLGLVAFLEAHHHNADAVHNAIALLAADAAQIAELGRERDELIHDMKRGIDNLNAEVNASAALEERVRVLEDALEAVKEFADADETLLCWKTADEALAAPPSKDE